MIDFSDNVDTPSAPPPKASSNHDMLAELQMPGAVDKPGDPIKRQDTDTSDVEEFVDAHS